MEAETEARRFEEDLGALGFRLVQQDKRGVRQYSQASGRYLTYWVHWNPYEAEVLFTWEVAIGELVHDHGMQIGADETLNIFLFPQFDAKGPAEIAFVAREIDRAEGALRSVDLTGGG